MSGRVRLLREITQQSAKRAKQRPRRQRTVQTFKKTARRELCAENGVPNTGRQWRLLRKRLARAERAQRQAAS